MSRTSPTTAVRTTLAAAILAAGALAAGVSVAQDSAAPAQAAHPHTHAKKGSHSAAAGNLKAQASYSLGVLMGTQLHQFGLNERAVDFQKVAQGLKDVVSGKVQATAADGQKVQELIRQSRSVAAQKNQAAARRFLAENGKRPGVMTTPSGLQYKVVSAGSGAPPSPTDQVTVNYRGTLLDGTEFDSSYKHGKPVTFAVNGVIKGWQEALVMMKPGAKWQLFIPPELAYGENSPPPIPPGSLLKFDVELLSVKPAGATTPGGAGPDIGAGTAH
ncbi:MAG: FKBP-type peptidyl-prolyl cis-trans isomerase [Steroidobacteraceae bacterium]